MAILKLYPWEMLILLGLAFGAGYLYHKWFSTPGCSPDDCPTCEHADNCNDVVVG